MCKILLAFIQKPPLFFILSILLVGCSSPTGISTAAAPNSEVTPQATQITQTDSVTIENQQYKIDEKCNQSSRVERFQIDSELLDGELFFGVYFPPCYSEEKVGGYPVLYALHGQNFNDYMWIDLGMINAVDELILDGDSQPFLIVMPYEEYFFRSAEGNKFPLALTEEIIPWVEGSLNACTERKCRSIGGISRGASWAIRIGLTDWEVFGSIGAHSLPTFRGDIGRLPEWLDLIPFGEEPRIYLDTGRLDPEVKTTSRFEQVLNEKGIPHEWHLNEGRHTELYWEGQMAEYVDWYASGWE